MSIFKQISRNRFVYILAIGVLSVALTACGSGEQAAPDGNKELEKVTMFLDWTPNTNHTGIYVAQEKGFYEEAGIDLEVLLPGEASAEQLVASNKGQFGISFQNHIIQARDEGLPLVSVAAIIKNDTSGYASPVDKGIETPKDFVGKMYGAYGAEIEEPMLDLVMERDGDASVKDVEIVQLGNSDFFVATKRDIDFVQIYYGWTGIEAEIRGVDLNFIKTSEFAEELNMYSPVLIANEKVINEDPETAQAFMDATIKGYDYAIEHPEEAADILIAAAPDLEPELVKRSQEWLSPRYQEDATKWGIQDLGRWETYAKFMFDEGIIENEIDSSKAFTNQFIE